MVCTRGAAGAALAVKGFNVSVAKVLLLSSCLFVLGACSEDDDEHLGMYPPPTPDTMGTLEFQWSIGGERDPAACAAAGALSFQSLIADGGFVVQDIAAACESFEASMPLYTDDFRARSALVNGNGYPVLRRIVEDLFVIEEGRVTRLVIDFPLPPLPMTPDAGGALPVPEVDAGIPPLEVPDAGLADAAP